MAWRPDRYLIEGELDNTVRGRVTGWMRFLGIRERVDFDLDGEFHRDIRGAKIHFYQASGINPDIEEAKAYMKTLSKCQSGRAGDITAGLPPRDYGATPYVEWYSHQNGRCVLELAHEQIQVIGTPIPFRESDSISREAQERNMDEHIYRIARELMLERNTDDQ